MLEARGLSVRREDRIVLDGVDLTLQAGDFLAVAGPNGAGKTTLLRCLAGVLAPSGGEVRLDGRPVDAVSRRVLARRVAYAPQESGERFAFTARQAVLMGRHPWLSRFAPASSGDEAAALRAMEAMDVAHLAERPVTTLSGGEKRRVALARTLAQADGADRAVLLLDEPAAGLDIRHALSSMRIFACRAAAGAAVAVVLHDLNLAAMFCPLTLLLDAGRVAAYGPTPGVLTPGNIRRVFGVRAETHGGCVRFLED
ncbi:MAG: ABC transporter ATP-binding protein [Thermodesulfobacteriota bacterium]